MDLDLVGTRHSVAPYWLEEIVLLLRRGATDSEILADLRTPAGGVVNSAETFPLNDEQTSTLVVELRAFIRPH
jgi:hypothetical protein